MFCTGCGTKSSVADQKFCDNCGASLQPAATQNVPPAPGFPPAPLGAPVPPQPIYSGAPQGGFGAPSAPAPNFGGQNYYGDPGRISSLNFFQSIKYCFAHYFVGKDRAVRSEYWYFYLGYIIYTRIVDVMFGNPQDGALGGLFLLVWLIPLTTASVRRMHDVGKSGWYLWIPIYNLILLCTEGEPGPNQYGDPVDYRGSV